MKKLKIEDIVAWSGAVLVVSFTVLVVSVIGLTVWHLYTGDFT